MRLITLSFSTKNDVVGQFINFSTYQKTHSLEPYTDFAIRVGDLESSDRRSPKTQLSFIGV